MKISNKQKRQNRLKIIGQAVDVMTSDGFKSATMRNIAKRAEIGEATIYNYFPTKESILFAYYEEKLNECVDRLKKVDKFNEFTLHEQLQTFFDTQLALFLPDREFIELSFKRIFFSLSQNSRQLKPIQDIFRSVIDDMFRAAVEVKEIPEQVLQEMIYLLLWDYYIGIVLFWLKDTSEMFVDTSVIVDKTLDLFCSVMKSGLVNKGVDILSYVFKNYVLNRFDVVRNRMDTMRLIKREFMRGVDGARDSRG